MRASRIYPGAIICLGIISFVIGSVVTTIPIVEYFTSVFVGNLIPSAPNGSLWTLTPEIVCYLYVLAFGVLGVAKTRFRILATLAAILLVHSIAPSAVLSSRTLNIPTS